MSDEDIKKYCHDRNEYPFEIPDTYMENLIGVKYQTAVCERPRVVTLRISTYMGCCEWAIHYYGKLTVRGPSIIEIGGDPNISHGGYLHGESEEFRKAVKGMCIEIDLWRDITEEERKKDPDRFEEWMDDTSAWVSETALIEFAKEVFNRRFKGDWKFEIQKDY